MHVTFFDRGDLDYERFNGMTDDGYLFVSFIWKNALTRVLEPFELPEDLNVLSNEIIVIEISQNRAENVFGLIKVLDLKANELDLIRIILI